MALTECRECRDEVAERAIMCPSCGAAAPDVAGGYGTNSTIPNALTIAGGVFLGVLAAGLVAWLVFGTVLTGLPG